MSNYCIENLNMNRMRNKRSTFTLALFLAGIVLVACQSSEKGENDQNIAQNVKVQLTLAQEERSLAMRDSIQQFKAESKSIISNNEKSIGAFKLKIENGDKAANIRYEKTVAQLEKNNNELKKKLEGYNDKETGNWQRFKSEFKSDMNKLGKAISDFTVE